MKRGSSKFHPNLTDEQLMNEIRKYYSTLKNTISDVTTLNEAVANIQSDISTLQSDVSDIDERVVELETPEE
jgi:peptidoglycan hydrolase CwlO-like protein